MSYGEQDFPKEGSFGPLSVFRPMAKKEENRVPTHIRFRLFQEMDLRRGAVEFIKKHRLIAQNIFLTKKVFM